MGTQDYFYDSYRLADYYDYMYDPIQYDLPFWKGFCAPNSEILELACGTGRVTLPLAHTGAKIWAADYSAEMLDLLRKRMSFHPMNVGSEIIALELDMRNFQLEQKFDCILITSNSLNHIETNQDIVRVFQCLKNHLKPNGRVVFDILNPEFHFLIRDPQKTYDRRVFAKGSSGEFFVQWESSRYDRESQINHVEYYFQECDEEGTPNDEEIKKMKMKVRLFFPQEISALL